MQNRTDIYFYNYSPISKINAIYSNGIEYISECFDKTYKVEISIDHLYCRYLKTIKLNCFHKVLYNIKKYANY